MKPQKKEVEEPEEEYPKYTTIIEKQIIKVMPGATFIWQSGQIPPTPPPKGGGS